MGCVPRALSARPTLLIVVGSPASIYALGAPVSTVSIARLGHNSYIGAKTVTFVPKMTPPANDRPLISVTRWPAKAACIGRHNSRAYRREAQFGCDVVGHTAGPYKPFVSKFVWLRLLESCVPAYLPIILLSNLAAVNLAASIAAIGPFSALAFLGTHAFLVSDNWRLCE